MFKLFKFIILKTCRCVPVVGLLQLYCSISWFLLVWDNNTWAAVFSVWVSCISLFFFNISHKLSGWCVPTELDAIYCVQKRPVSFTFLLDTVTLGSTIEVLSHCKSFSSEPQRQPNCNTSHSTVCTCACVCLCSTICSLHLSVAVSRHQRALAYNKHELSS